MSMVMETNNQRICSFYKLNPSINFETVNLLFIDLFEKLISNVDSNITTTINSQILSNICDNSSKINDIKTSVSSLKDVVYDINKENFNMIHEQQHKIIDEIGNMIFKSNKNIPIQNNTSVDYLATLLNKLYNTSEVLKLKEFDDSHIYSLKRYMKPKILIENKDIDYNIQSDDIGSFVKLIEERNCHGLYLSQKSGISIKPNYHIDYHRGNIVIYLHNVDYCSEKIKTAIDIIDSLSSKLKEFNNTNDDNTIPKSLLDDINKEYQLFITQKEAVINVYKDCQKKVLSQIDELRFPCLDKYLSTKYTNQVVKQGFKCDLCKCFNANNLKALAAHKRGCARKNVLVNITNTVNNTV